MILNCLEVPFASRCGGPMRRITNPIGPDACNAASETNLQPARSVAHSQRQGGCQRLRWRCLCNGGRWEMSETHQPLALAITANERVPAARAWLQAYATALETATEVFSGYQSRRRGPCTPRNARGSRSARRSIVPPSASIDPQ